MTLHFRPDGTVNVRIDGEPGEENWGWHVAGDRLFYEFGDSAHTLRFWEAIEPVRDYFGWWLLSPNADGSRRILRVGPNTITMHCDVNDGETETLTRLPE